MFSLRPSRSHSNLRGAGWLALVLAALIGLLPAPFARADSLIFNSSLLTGPATAPRPDAAQVQHLRSSGWSCPDPDRWPMWWSPRGTKATFETFADGGKEGAYARISGKEGSVLCPAYPLKDWLRREKAEEHKKYGDDYLLSVWVRGKGQLRVSFEARQQTENGEVVSKVAPEPFLVKVDTGGKWMLYSHVIRRRAEFSAVDVAVGAPEGALDFDELTLWPAEPGRQMVIQELEQLYGTGALVENLELVRADQTFFAKAAEFESAVKSVRGKAGSLDATRFHSINKVIDEVSPYALTHGITVVQAGHYNDIIALTRVLRRLAEQPVGPPVAITVTEAPVTGSTHRPGERMARAGRVTITDIRSNKVRYVENETAHTKAVLVNQTREAKSGTLVALMHLDVDIIREIARAPFTIGADESKTWEFSYNVGAETYGRGIEVKFLDDQARLLDTWQGFYAVAAEYFRVHQHSYQGPVKTYKVDFWTTYFNQAHFYASEPTDFGVRPTSAEVYLSGLAGYRINWPSRKYQMAGMKNAGIALTFYQNAGFCGPMGYEEIRKHPEYALYDANGQLGVDPIYGGTPNPMELASPVEVGPARKVTKPYLGREYRPYQHVIANLAMEDAVVYEANLIKEYAKTYGFDGCYWDGNLGVSKGYAYDGTPNVPSDKYEDYVQLNARNHRLYSEMLKKDNPNFGTWYNWGMVGVEYFTEKGHRSYLGTGGTAGDPSDASIRAATSWKNVMLLNEVQRLTDTMGEPQKVLDALLQERDKFVQSLGANMLIGYFQPGALGLGLSEDEPGPSRWGWVAVNHFLAQLIATQHHMAGSFSPSMRPGFQFQARYSRFIWAPDVKAVPVAEVEKLVAVSRAEQLWWKQLVYRRKTAEGYDLILHLVRIPPFTQWDINWVDEPAPLQGVRITMNLDAGTPAAAHAMRPYDYEEEQQPVEQVIVPATNGRQVTLEVPAFRYHTMVVIHMSPPGS